LKFSTFSHVAQKVFDLESWNFTGMLISMCSCAPGVSLVYLFCFVRFIALDLVKSVTLCCVICSSSAWVRINQLYRNNDQHHCEAMHLGFCMWIFSVLLELLYKFAIFNLFMHNSKIIWPVGLKVYKNVGQPCTYAPWSLLVDLFSI
jgi:hypothetical protein